MVHIENYNPIISINLERKLPAGNYYYVEINPGTKQQIRKFGYLSDYLIQNNKILLLDNSTEGFSFNIPYIYEELVIKSQIPESHIFLMSGAADIKQIIEYTAKLYNRLPIHSDWFLPFQHGIADEVFYRKSNLFDVDYQNKMHDFRKNNYQKIFLNLNRRWRMHRLAFVTLLKAKNLLSNGYVSLTKSDDNITWQDYYDEVKKEHQTDEETYNILDNYQQIMYNMNPLILDKNELIENEAHLTDSIEDYYWTSILNVTSETNFYTNNKLLAKSGKPLNEPTKFISEKTFKPIVYLQPFIIISVPNFLPLLHNLGYKTFHPFIDESYDKEVNDYKRMMMIIREIEKFSSYSRIELAEFLDQTWYICQHNFKQLFKNTHLVDRLVTKL